MVFVEPFSRHLGSFFASGGILGPAWSVLEASWVVAGESLGIYKGSGSVLEASWPVLGALLAVLAASYSKKSFLFGDY